MHTSIAHIPSRRIFLCGTASSGALLLASAARPSGSPPAASTDLAADRSDARAYSYEIAHSDGDWRAQLSQEEYVILRKGSTELPHTSKLVGEARSGVYHCKACAPRCL